MHQYIQLIHIHSSSATLSRCLHSHPFNTCLEDVISTTVCSVHFSVYVQYTVIFLSDSFALSLCRSSDIFIPIACEKDRLTRRSFVRNRITDTPRPRSAHARAALLLSPTDSRNRFRAGLVLQG